MVESDDIAQLEKRHEIVMLMTQLNSNQLQCNSERNGLDFELLGIKSRIEGRDPTAEESEEISVLEQKIETATQKQKARQQKLEELEIALQQLNEA